MKAIARIITRPDENNQTELIIGTCFKKQKALKPNRVYEIIQILGELIICEVGESVIGKTLKDGHSNVCWGTDVNTILETGIQNWLTIEEKLSLEKGN